MNRTTLSLALSALILVPTTMSGCLVSSSRASKIDGAYVQPGSISKIHIGETTQVETEEILGQPSIRSQNSDGTETWTWNWTETKGESGAVLLVFAGSSKKTVAESVHVKFENNVVVKKWRD